MRWKQADAPRDIMTIEYESELGLAGIWRIVGVDDEAGEHRVVARATRVEDSSDGVVWLIVGGKHGLLLEHPNGSMERQPYLLLSRETKVG